MTKPSADKESGWPQWKKDKLLEMKKAKKTGKEIAEALGKTPGSVANQWHYMQKTDPRAADVPEIKCNRRPWSKNAAAMRAEMSLPGEVTTYVDELGRTVKRFPPGYAVGIYPAASVGSRSSG